MVMVMGNFWPAVHANSVALGASAAENPHIAQAQYDGIGPDAPMFNFGGGLGYGGMGGIGGLDCGMMGMGLGMGGLGGGMGLGMMGGMGCMGGMGMMGMNPTQLQYSNQMNGMMLDNQSQMDNRMIDYQTDRRVHIKDKERYADSRLRGPEFAVAHQAEILRELVSQHRLSQIPLQYSNFITTIKKLYPDADEHVIKSIAAQQYDLAGDLSGNSRFLENVIKGTGIGLFTGFKDSQDITSEATGVPLAGRDYAVKAAGLTIGALGTTALVTRGNIFSHLWSGIKWIMPCLAKIKRL